MALQFTERQSRTIAAAITTLSTLVILVVIGLLGWLAALFLRTFSGVFLPLAVGAVAALVFRPYYEWLHTTARLGVALAVTAVLFWFLSKDDPVTAARRGSAASRRSLRAEFAPLRNLQVWRFSAYYFFAFGAFVALAFLADAGLQEVADGAAVVGLRELLREGLVPDVRPGLR